MDRLRNYPRVGAFITHTLLLSSLYGAHDASAQGVEDAALAEVAQRHAEQILRDEHNAHLDGVMELLRAQGLSDTQVLPFASVGRSLEALESALTEFKEAIPTKRGFTHWGKGHRVSANGKRHALVGIFSRRLVTISPISKHPQKPVLKLSLKPVSSAQRGKLRAYLATPAGNVHALRIGSDTTRGDFHVTLHFSEGPGPYVFETLIDGKRGPEVTALWQFDYGLSSSPRRKAPERLRLPDTLDTLEALVRRARTKSNRPVLKRNVKLDAIAASHAQSVCEAMLAAHILPGGNAPSDRAKKQDYRKAITENVAIAQTIGRAHENFMKSPSHRMNVLDPRAMEMGLGLASRAAKAASSRFDKRPARTWCVVQVFGLSAVASK